MVCLCGSFVDGGLDFLYPDSILIIIGSVGIHRRIEIWHYHQRFYLIHHGHKLFGWCPLISRLEHIRTNLPFLIHIWVVNLSFEADDWALEWEIIELEFDFILTSLER